MDQAACEEWRAEQFKHMDPAWVDVLEPGAAYPEPNEARHSPELVAAQPTRIPAEIPVPVEVLT
eukprot:scaffold83335_cov37-Phaeocystis_antarctica.AAC.1